MSRRRRRGTTWLPMTILRPFGPCEAEAEQFENVILDAIDGGGMDPGPPPSDDADQRGAVLVEGAEAFDRVREALAQSDEDDKESIAAALEEAARDPVRYVVVATEAGPAFGVVVLGRSIEYIASPSGGPFAIRYVTEILAAPSSEHAAALVATTAVSQICLGFFVLCRRVAHVARTLAEAKAAVMDTDDDGIVAMPVQVHLRATPGADHGLGVLITDFLTAYDEFLGRFGIDDGFEMLRITGPYLPGTLFADPDPSGDTVVRLRTREILRRSNLLGRSAVAAYRVGGFSGPDGQHFHAYEADEDMLDAADVILDPSYPRCGEVFEDAGDSVGRSLVQVHPCGQLEALVVLEIARGLNVAVEGDGFTAVLDLSVPAILGDFNDADMVSAIAVVLSFHAKMDIANLHADLAGHVQGLRARFSVPPGIASELRVQVDVLLEDMRELPWGGTPPAVEILEIEPRKPVGKTMPPLTQLHRPGHVDFEAVTDAIEEEDAEIEVAQIEVLRRRGKRLVWVDGLDVPASTRDPFVLARAWVEDGPPIPVVVSSLSGKTFAGDIEIFRLVLGRLQAGPARRSGPPAVLAELRVLAERMFRNTSIAVALLEHLVPEPREGVVMANDPDMDEESAAHLAKVGGAQDSEDQDLAAYEHQYAPASRFHIALSASAQAEAVAQGAAATLAEYLLRSAEILIDGEEPDFQRLVADPQVLFLFAYAYVRRCCPDAVSAAEFEAAARKVADRPGDGRLPTLGNIPPDLAAEITRRVEAAADANTRTPLYLAVARIGAVFEAAVEDWRGYGLTV